QDTPTVYSCAIDSRGAAAVRDKASAISTFFIVVSPVSDHFLLLVAGSSETVPIFIFIPEVILDRKITEVNK
ncbi:MAG: hypothetical protein WD668_11610, partial [Saccharospirillum sp.]